MRLYVFTATKRPIDEMGRIALPQELRDLLKLKHRELKTDRQALYLRKLYGTHALHEKSVLIANAFYPLF